jgi:hypothetical protein
MTPTIIPVGRHGRILINHLGDGTTALTLERGGSGITEILNEDQHKQVADALCRLIAECGCGQ